MMTKQDVIDTLTQAGREAAAAGAAEVFAAYEAQIADLKTGLGNSDTQLQALRATVDSSQQQIQTMQVQQAAERQKAQNEADAAAQQIAGLTAQLAQYKGPAAPPVQTPPTTP